MEEGRKEGGKMRLGKEKGMKEERKRENKQTKTTSYGAVYSGESKHVITN